MKLQTSILPRRDGKVTLTAKDGQKCVFAPGPDGELVGEVNDPETVAELLNGSMFFPADPADFDEALVLTGKKFDGSDVLVDAGNSDGVPLEGSNNFEANIEVGDKTVTLGEAVALAHAASGLSVEEWNALTETERDDLIEAELNRMDGDGDEKPAGGQPLEAQTPPAADPKATKANGGKKAK